MNGLRLCVCLCGSVAVNGDGRGCVLCRGVVGVCASAVCGGLWLMILLFAGFWLSPALICMQVIVKDCYEFLAPPSLDCAGFSFIVNIRVFFYKKNNRILGLGEEKQHLLLKLGSKRVFSGLGLAR